MVSIVGLGFDWHQCLCLAVSPPGRRWAHRRAHWTVDECCHQWAELIRRACCMPTKPIKAGRSSENAKMSSMRPEIARSGALPSIHSDWRAQQSSGEPFPLSSCTRTMYVGLKGCVTCHKKCYFLPWAWPVRDGGGETRYAGSRVRDFPPLMCHHERGTVFGLSCRRIQGVRMQSVVDG